MLGVNYRTLYEWSEQPGFPGRMGQRGVSRSGYFPLAEIRAWRAGVAAAQGRSGTQVEAKKAQAVRGELLDIRRIRELAELERDTLGTLVDAQQVTSFLQTTIATATAQLDELPDRIDAGLPDRLGPKARRVIRRTVRKVTREVLHTIAELVRGDRDEGGEE
jgi:hypothetical protein